MVAIKRAIEPYQQQKAKERQIRTNVSPAKFAEQKLGNSRDIVAGFVGVSHTTLSKAEDIVKP